MAYHNPFQSIISAFLALFIGASIISVVVIDYLYKYSDFVGFTFIRVFIIDGKYYLFDIRLALYFLLLIYAISFIKGIPNYFKQYKARKYGVKTEHKWFNILKRDYSNGNIKVWKDPFFYKGIGDTDAIVTYKNVVYVIEIKSHYIINIKGNSIFDKNNKPFRKDFLKQSFDLAKAVHQRKGCNTTPILWFPNASNQNKTVTINGVIVIRGKPNKLINTIKYLHR